MLEYNDRLLYVTGFGIIIFILASLVLVLFPILLPKWFKTEEWESGPDLTLNLILLALSSASYAFYIRYVGETSLTLYVLFKSVLVCLLPIASLAILYKIKSLERIITRLLDKNRSLNYRINEFEVAEGDKEVILSADNQSNPLRLKYRQIVAVRSADNYVEVYHFTEDTLSKKVIRNTLKNIFSKLSSQNEFIRCHRAGIINITHAEKLFRSYGGHMIKMYGLEEPVPVSRQYLIQVKEALAAEN